MQVVDLSAQGPVVQSTDRLIVLNLPGTGVMAVDDLVSLQMYDEQQLVGVLTSTAGDFLVVPGARQLHLRFREEVTRYWYLRRPFVRQAALRTLRGVPIHFSRSGEERPWSGRSEVVIAFERSLARGYGRPAASV